MSTIQIQSYGSKRQNALNVVMPSKRFTNLTEFEKYTAELFTHLDMSKPHFFLFPEAPFIAGYVPSRRYAKQVVRRLSDLLAVKSPTSKIAFSLFEKARLGAVTRRDVGKTFYHNGYVISSEGVKVYPKNSLHGSNNDAFSDFAEYELGRLELPGAWTKRVGVVANRHKSLFGLPKISFPTGHSFEYRVCADLNKGHEAPVAVSANEYSDFQNLLKSKHGSSLLLINDIAEKEKVGRTNNGYTRAVKKGGRMFSHLFNPDQSFLREEKLRVHIVD